MALLQRVAVVFSALIFLFPIAVSAAAGPLTGYAWSETIGWVSFNCSNTSSCGTVNYGMTAASDGTLSGYAWSDNIGWISANTSDLTSCPSGTCNAKITGSALTGWFKALGANGNGWDGWISLSGSGYGPTLSSGTFSGYAWGSDVVGWLQFDAGSIPVATTYTACTAGYHCVGNSQYYMDNMCVDTLQQACSYQCVSNVCIAPPAPAGNLSGGVSLKAVPTLVKFNATSAITWGVNNVASCVVSGTNGDLWNGTSGTRTSKAITQQVVYTLNCVDLVGASSTVGTVTVSLVPRWQEK